MMTENEESMVREIISELRDMIREGRELIETIRSECEEICCAIREATPGGGGPGGGGGGGGPGNP